MLGKKEVVTLVLKVQQKGRFKCRRATDFSRISTLVKRENITLKFGTQDGLKKTTSFAFGSLKIKYTDIDMILINIPDADNRKESSSP